MASNFFSPYYDQNFFQVIGQFFYRMSTLVSGNLAWSDLASDDIQILVLMGVAASSALVGSFLVLRRMTMLANSLSHTILMGIVLAYFFSNEGPNHSHDSTPPMQSMLIASLIMGFITAFLTEFLTKVGRLQEDASTGLVFTSLFALGVIALTILTKNAHIGTEAIMGNADALHIDDIKWTYWILGGNALLISLFFKEFKITTFDPALAAALGFSTLFFNYLLMAQVSATSISAFRAVGVLLVLAFMTGPVLTARLLVSDLKQLVLVAVGLGMLASLIGVALARHILSNWGIALSTSGLVVCCIAILYMLAILFAPQRGLILTWIYKRKLQNNL
jgi:manganese/zinc/iron transport system permease protein